MNNDLRPKLEALIKAAVDLIMVHHGLDYDLTVEERTDFAKDLAAAYLDESPRRCASKLRQLLKESVAVDPSFVKQIDEWRNRSKEKS
jgi:hypothetical protein